MEGLGGLFLRVLAISAGCSAVLAPVLLLAPRVQKKVAARSFYVLFLLLALRLTLPLEVKLPAPVVRVQVPVTVTVAAPRPAAPVQPVQAPAVQSPAAGSGQAVHTPAVRPQVAQPAPAARSIPLLHIAAAVWAAGAAACALWSMARYTAARRKLLKSSVSAMERDIQLMDRLRGELGVKRPIRLRVSIAASTPLALGLLRPTILLPGREVPELVLRHELTHIRRWDIAYKLILSLACWVNWFNPLVWLMDRAARQNLELCCDDEAVRGLPDTERRRYADMLLDAAQTARPIPFSTCFSGGKVQMKERLVNLFTNKKNSAVLVCLVLAAALLAGGLVACEKASGSEVTLSPENQARRALFQTYFDRNYTEDNASVVLADLTGDGLEEMLVLTLDPDVAEPPSLRGELVEFSCGSIEYFGVDGDAVVQYPAASVVSSSHAGWGYVYLVPWEAGWAIADFRPYIGQGMADYDYSIYTLGEDGEFAAQEQEEVFFQIDTDSLMGEDMGGNSATEDVERFLSRWSALRDSGVPLLTYYAWDNREISYLSVSPADAFGGTVKMAVPELLDRVVGSGASSSFPKPESDPATPEEALDRLEAGLTSASFYPNGFVFRLPNYEGTWDVQISGWARMGDSGEPVPVRYLEDEAWVSGRRYDVNTEERWFDTPGLSFAPGTGDAVHAWAITTDEGCKEIILPPHDIEGVMNPREIWFDELTLSARATAPDGTSADRIIDLRELMEEYAWKSLMDVGCCTPEAVAASYLETVARRMYLYEEGSGLLLTAFYGGQSQVASYIPDREYVLYEGHTLSQREVMDRLIYKEDGANALKYLWMAERGPMEDVSINYTVERVQTRGGSALVDVTEDIQFRCQGQTEPSQSTIRYQVDLVLCEGKWLVADVNHWGHFITWSDSWDEDSCCELTGLPHSMNWFNDWFGRAAGHEEILKVTDGDTAKLPCCCLAGRVLEDGNLELICAMADGWMCRMTVRLLADDSVEILAVSPWAA